VDAFGTPRVGERSDNALIAPFEIAALSPTERFNAAAFYRWRAISKQLPSRVIC
jgi:hypothetical protein